MIFSRFELTNLGVAAVLAFTGAALAPAAGLGKETGDRLLARCEAAQHSGDAAEALNPSERAGAEACAAFLDGFVWGHAWGSWRESKDMWFCLPEGFSGQQAVPVVVEYLQAHPDRMTEDAHLLVFLALTASYPCKP